MFRFFLFICLLIVIVHAIHPITPSYIQHLKNNAQQEYNIESQHTRDTIPEYYYTQTLDHFNHQDQRTYQQRYFRNDSFWSPEQSGPIFLQIGGEGAISSAYVTDDFEMVVYAQQHAALVVALEHRFYGKSQPFSDISTPNLQYLSSEQALADVAQFIQWIRDTWSGVDENTQFVTFGCSYPGNLAAWFRMKYPQHTSGSVAGSSPVHAVLDFFQYLDVVDESLTAFTGIECDARINNATLQIENMLQTSSGQNQLQNDFKTCSALDNTMDISTFMSDLMGNWMGTVQYNDEQGNPIDINYLCSIMNNSTLSAYDAYVQVNDLFLSLNNAQCLSISYSAMIQELQLTKALPFGVGFRQWTYQTCFEFGYYQTTDSPNQPFGNLVPIDYYLQMCNDTFSPQGSIVMDPELNVNQTNALYGGNKPHGTTKIVFVNGSIDPWHSISVTTDINDSVQAILIQGTAHCANTIPYIEGQYPVSLYYAQEQINVIIGDWLEDGNQ